MASVKSPARASNGPLIGQRKKIVYPTGFTTERVQITSPRGRVRLEVERTVKQGRNGIAIDQIGDVTVSGSCVPIGATGLICHETLPCITFTIRRHGWDGAWVKAMEKARQIYDAVIGDCEGGAK